MKKTNAYNVRIEVVDGKPSILFVHSLRREKKGYRWTSISGKKLSKMIKVPLFYK